MQSRTLSKDPIDFPLIDIEVESVKGYKIISWLSEHDTLKDAVLACEFEFESSMNNNDRFWVLNDESKYYVVDRLCQITNLSGEY